MLCAQGVAERVRRQQGLQDEYVTGRRISRTSHGIAMQASVQQGTQGV